ncbi:PIN domain-containing protein [Nocardia higoensis]|uniref:PIN domain-containing protein n=1 Tax=Nocardia higoensis TaxID=228599 RepID=UPI0012F7022F|nr:PIN domain-containing protein [Nocardia higoensis]
MLTEKGKHRSAGVSDLLIAATAEAHGLTVLHYDRDFETVREVTGQPTQWIAPPGSTA